MGIGREEVGHENVLSEEFLLTCGTSYCPTENHLDIDDENASNSTLFFVNNYKTTGNRFFIYVTLIIIIIKYVNLRQNLAHFFSFNPKHLRHKVIDPSPFMAMTPFTDGWDLDVSSNLDIKSFFCDKVVLLFIWVFWPQWIQKYFKKTKQLFQLFFNEQYYPKMRIILHVLILYILINLIGILWSLLATGCYIYICFSI